MYEFIPYSIGALQIKFKKKKNFFYLNDVTLFKTFVLGPLFLLSTEIRN